MAFYEQEFKLNFRDTGNTNKLTNKGLLGYLEDIGGIHSEKVGLGLSTIFETRLSWVLLGWKVQVLTRPTYGTKIRIKTWASHTEKFYTYREFEIYDENGKKVAIASSKWVLINIDTAKLTKITDDIINKYEPEENHVFEQIDLDKLQKPEFHSSEYEYKVQRCNIDINKHMHNLYYLDLAYEALPDEIYDNMEFDNFEIMYKKQIRYGNTIKCLYTNNESSHIVTIKSEDSKDIHAIIRFSNNI